MQIKMIEEEIGQGLVPLECKFAESKADKKTLLLIKNQELYHLFVNEVNQNKYVEIYHSTNILYFLYNNTKYFTDKFGFIISNSLKNGTKSFGIAFIDDNEQIIGQWYNYDL